MTLIKKSQNIFPQFPTFFDDFLVRQWNEQVLTSPSANILETDTEFRISLAAPGLKKEDFKIELNHEILTISSEKSLESQDQGKFTRREFRFGSFQRSFTIPKGAVEGEKIAASYSDGILVVTLPKSEEVRPKPIRNIAIS